MFPLPEHPRATIVNGTVEVSVDHFFNGKRVASAHTFEDRSPLDWDLLLANVSRGDAAVANAAITSAVEADPAWAALGTTGRGPIMGVAAAQNLAPFTAELGGKGPFIVLDDADLDVAAKKAAVMFDDSGQVCLAGTRLLVQLGVRDESLRCFHAFTDAHVLGDSQGPGTTISPVIHPEHLALVAGFVDRARAAGDTVVRGGKVWRDGGLWYKPTVVEPKSNDSEIVQHEVFGPVVTVQPFATDDDAVVLANSTAYGLSAMVFTTSAERADHLGRAVRAGTTWVNTFLAHDLSAPFSGMGISGIGRESGDEALDFCSDLKTLQIVEGSVG